MFEVLVRFLYLSLKGASAKPRKNFFVAVCIVRNIDSINYFESKALTIKRTATFHLAVALGDCLMLD